jgi:hypothetical protein
MPQSPGHGLSVIKPLVRCEVLRNEELRYHFSVIEFRKVQPPCVTDLCTAHITLDEFT